MKDKKKYWYAFDQPDIVVEMAIMAGFLDDLGDEEYSKLEDALDEAIDYYRRNEHEFD